MFVCVKTVDMVPLLSKSEIVSIVNYEEVNLLFYL